MQHVRTHEPATIVDKMIIGAYIEARSCERFAKLAPHLDAMRQRIAECLKIERHRVSVKPKTNEGVGPEGRGEAVSAQAIVLFLIILALTVLEFVILEKKVFYK